MINKKLIALISSTMLMFSTILGMTKPNGVYLEEKNSAKDVAYISYDDYVRAFVSNDISFKNSLSRFNIKGISLDTENNKKVIDYTNYIDAYNKNKVNMGNYANAKDSVIYNNPLKVKPLNKDGSLGIEIDSPDVENPPGEDNPGNNTPGELPENLKTYYQTAIGKEGNELRKALHDIIDDHKKLTYAQVWDALKETDEDPNNKENVILLYTGFSQSKDTNGGNANQWNREHVWAKSRGDFGTSAGAGTDIHHLRPTLVTVNSARGNMDFDEGGTPHKIATGCKYDSDSWEPRDEVKGDVARMLFYMAIRYEGDVSGEPDLEIIDKISTASKAGNIGKLSVLLKWHKQDPVDDFERNRNNVIEKYQQNRNPFIDNPEWVDSINWSK